MLQRADQAVQGFPSEALRKMQQKTYSREDARKQTRCQILCRVGQAKAAEFSSTIQQLSQAYNNIDPELRMHLTRPGPQTTLASFMEEAVEKAES
jgi:hypothetical protein